MNEERCPLCGQPLPKMITLKDLELKLNKIYAPLLKQEQERISKEAEEKAKQEFMQKEARLRAQIEREVKEKSAKELESEKEKREEAERSLKEMQSDFASKESQIRKQLEKEIEAKKQKELEDEKRKRTEAERRAQRLELDLNQAQKGGERIGAQKERNKLLPQIEELKRKLEMQTSESMGTQAEIDLFSELEKTFPKDKIERVGKGKKGADIIHIVIENGQEMGKIIYESKNVLQWQNSFISKAKGYQREYETSYVMLVSCAFPRKQNNFCVEKGIPIVHPQFAISLARVMREAVVQVGRLESSQSGKDSKANELFEYIISSDFQARFKSVAEAAGTLRDYQNAEKTWHENHWKKQGKQFELFEDFHRKVKANLDEIIVAAKGQKGKLSVVN